MAKEKAGTITMTQEDLNKAIQEAVAKALTERGTTSTRTTKAKVGDSITFESEKSDQTTKDGKRSKFFGTKDNQFDAGMIITLPKASNIKKIKVTVEVLEV